MLKRKSMILNDTGNLEKEIGHLVVNAEIKEDIADWMEKCDGNIEKCLVVYIERDSGNLKVFGTNMPTGIIAIL